jgi:putative transposase
MFYGSIKIQSKISLLKQKRKNRMPRPLRIEFEDAWYHVMNRGAGYQPIYQTERHRELFLTILGEASILFGIEIHAYCLMDNHYHLLIKTPRANLSRAMRHINGVYTQRYNRLVKKDGSLFRGRYKAIIVEKNDYLLQVSRYIHLNPVSAKITTFPSDYKWSSYQNYIKEKKSPEWLRIDEILSIFSQKRNAEEYRQFVEKEVDIETKTFYEKDKTAIIFGSNSFKERILTQIQEEKILASTPDYNRTRTLPSGSKIEKIIAHYFSVDIKTLYQGTQGQRNLPRSLSIYACRLWSSEPLAALAQRYGCKTLSNMSNIISDVKKSIQADKKLARTVDEIRNIVFEE